MQTSVKVLVIGPQQQISGGVATHIRNLQQLNAFENAVFYDPGSIHSQQNQAWYLIIYRLWQLRKIVKKESFAKIFINSSIFPFAFLKLLLTLFLLPKKPAGNIHVFFHGGRFDNSKLYSRSWLILLQRRLISVASRYHFLSPIQQQQFSQRFPQPDTAIYYNYSPDDQVVAKDVNTHNELRLLFVGRVIAAKGIFELLRALEILTQAGDYPLRLQIVGEGEDLERLKQQASALIAQKTVEFSGYLQGAALENAYRQADVLVLPTYYPEGFPYVLIEAFRFGVPVLATAEGALGLLVEDDVTGYQIEPKNPQSIVTALEKILHQRNRLDIMIKHCHQVFQQQLSRLAAERYYSQLLNSH